VTSSEHLSLLISDEYTFVNAEILRAGLGKLPKRIPRGANKEIIEFLRSAQDEAFRAVRLRSPLWCCCLLGLTQGCVCASSMLASGSMAMMARTMSRTHEGMNQENVVVMSRTHE